MHMDKSHKVFSKLTLATQPKMFLSADLSANDGCNRKQLANLKIDEKKLFIKEVF